MTDYMTCKPIALPEAAKQKALDWAKEGKCVGITNWTVGDIDGNSSLAYVARYIATQTDAAVKVTEADRATARRIVADHYDCNNVEEISADCAEVLFVMKGMAFSTQDTATKPSTESHEDAAERIATEHWGENTISWDTARLSFLYALRHGDLLLPPQQAETVDPDLVNARLLASKVSDTGMDYTDGKHDCFVNVQVFYKAHQRGLIKMGDGV